MRVAALALRSGDQRRLMEWTRSSSIRAGLAQRARIILLAADGVSNTAIAELVGVSRPTVTSWRARYDADGIDGLIDEPRSGRPREVDRSKIIAVTLTPPPKKLGITHWSSRLLADHLKTSNSTIAKTWREAGVQPWRSETFKFSTDPELVAKVTDIVGLYLDPPETAIVLCVDEKSQIQALDRTAPMLPMQPFVPETDPRLRPARHHHPVRGSGHRDRADHRVVPTAASAPGVPAVPQAGREELPDRGIAPGDGQLRRPQTGGDQDLARREPEDPRSFHPDLRVLDEPGRGLVRHHRTASNPPGHLHLRH